MFITNLELKNIRGFRHLVIPFLSNGGAPRFKTAIIGRNGTGKTTFLRSIALGLCDKPQANSLLSESIGGLISEGQKDATIAITVIQSRRDRNLTKITTTLSKQGGRDVVIDQDPEIRRVPGKVFVCAYGAGRSTEGIDVVRDYQIIDSVYSLFNYETTLTATEVTLLRLEKYLDDKYFQATKKGIMRALGLSEDHDVKTIKGGGVRITGPSVGTKGVAIEAWADGYRRTFNWILDLYGWAMRAKTVTRAGRVTGVLLVDELEQHLHPSMQMNLLSQLANLLPNLQVISTTHSPLVALGLNADELVPLKRFYGEVIVEEETPDFSGYSAEDMLVDDRLFATSPYPPETSRLLKRYRELSARPKEELSKTEMAQLARVARILQQQRVPEVRENPLEDELRKLREKLGL